MIATLPLKKMSIQDKISAMESIWEDLCQNAGDIASPEWHKDILKEREKNRNPALIHFLTGKMPKSKSGKKSGE